MGGINKFGAGGKRCPVDLEEYRLNGKEYTVVTFNFSSEDIKILNRIKKSTGINKSLIVRYAIRQVSKKLLRKYKKVDFNWE